jgi:hypothetical protein
MLALLNYEAVANGCLELARHRIEMAFDAPGQVFARWAPGKGLSAQFAVHPQVVEKFGTNMIATIEKEIWMEAVLPLMRHRLNTIGERRRGSQKEKSPRKLQEAAPEESREEEGPEEGPREGEAGEGAVGEAHAGAPEAEAGAGGSG